MASNVTRFDPFGDLTRWSPLSTFDELVRDMAPRWAMREMQQGEPMIGLDVAETEKDYTVRAHIPGVKKEDIKVDLRGNRVSITAETRRESEQKEGSRVLRSELFYGQQHRSFTLDQDVDETKAEAKYADGVLELTLPKKMGGGGAKLQVH